ncbi:MAG TPA: HAD-IA family hydrolase [Acidimicrobiales bacterium]|nr:HAD-IA family hydrolase [Acidimicrobiales bacterium]
MDSLGLRAWLFDVDGVLTDTASVHAEAWKQVLDGLLGRRDQAPFDPVVDYERHLDGRPGAAGVRSFLASRGIVLPDAGHADAGHPTIESVGKEENECFLALLRAHGVRPYPSSLALVRALLDAGRLTAAVSSGEHCVPILEAAGMHGLFYVVVDGKVATTRHLKGKPAPDTYWYAAALLGVRPREAAVVEDALAGVRAGQIGEFGYVVGIARRATPRLLFEAGADVVVSDLGDFAELMALLTRWAKTPVASGAAR